MDDRSMERIGSNEAAFRNVNEKLRASAGLALTDKLFPFTCECGGLGCNRLLELTLPEYERVRADPRLFFLVDGHEMPDTEDIVERYERFSVVRKQDAAASVAEATDPRA